MKEQVEIVMATYNGEKYIKEQLDSLLSQSYPDLLVDVCDDGSTDGTVSIVKEYKKRTVVYVSLKIRQIKGI